MKTNTILKNFIVFEGLDGAGTTTQAKMLLEALQKSGKNVYFDAEPTSSPIGHLIRETYLKKNATTTPLALAMLYSADREDHLNNQEYGVKKRLNDGAIVISDRYFYSSIAYQGVNIDHSVIEKLNDFESPEYLIYIDTSVNVCLKRIDKRGCEKELFEHKSFLEKTKEGFDRTFSHIPQGVNFLHINGEDDIQTISLKIAEFVAS